MYLKQNDFNRMTKKIHNKFIFEKIVAMIMMSKNLKKNQSIKRDILIQNIENDDLMSIFVELCNQHFGLNHVIINVSRVKDYIIEN